LLGEDVYSYWQRIQTIPNVTIRDIREHHRRTHTTDNMRFVIAGKLDGRKAQIQRMLESWELPRGERFVVPKDELTSGNPTLIRRKEASNLTFGWSMTLPRELSDEESEAMACLDQILTGTLHSRIYGAARKKGLAYGMFSETSVGFHDSSWDFGGQVNLDTADGLVDIIVREVKAVLDGKITEDELASAKSYALGRHQMGAQTVSQISNFYSGRYFGDGVVKDYEKVPDAIRGITRERMLATAREFIAHNTWVLAGVSSGNKEELVVLNNKLETIFAPTQN
jgi:predicted Zn-dependent peptidase